MEIRENFELEGPVSYAVHRRDQIKLRGNPTIVICMPIGAKDTNTIFETPDGTKWIGPGCTAPAVVPIQWALNHMRIVTPLNTSMTYLVKWGERSAKARQFMTMEALKMNPDYILYWDDDVLVEPLSLYTLYNFMQQTPEAGIVSAVYMTRNDPTEPMIYKTHGEGAYWGFQAGEGAEPEEIFSAGAGFMLARASAIRDIIEQNPGEPVWADEFVTQLPGEVPNAEKRSSMWGHDIRFCKLMYEAGHKVFVDGRVVCGHIDIATSKIYTLPADSLPYKNNGNINKKGYWDQIYTQEGANSWRTYPEMFERVCQEIPVGSKCFEVGCGVGILGSRVTATRQVEYSGVDISQVAVDIATTRFLSCRRAAVRDLSPADFATPTVVVATEIVEHLGQEDLEHLLSLVAGSPTVEKFVFTVPDDCMGPDEVLEHQAKYTKESLADLLDRAFYKANESFRIEKVDEHHLMAVVERKWLPTG